MSPPHRLQSVVASVASLPGGNRPSRALPTVIGKSTAALTKMATDLTGRTRFWMTVRVTTGNLSATLTPIHSILVLPDCNMLVSDQPRVPADVEVEQRGAAEEIGVKVCVFA